MADVLDSAALWLAGQRHKHMARPVGYQRDNNVVAVDATIGSTDFEQSDDSGFIHRVQARDYIVRTQDLAINGVPITPQPGDVIHEHDAATGRTYVYEVRAFGSEPPWRWSDPFRRAMRIHTKLVDNQ